MAIAARPRFRAAFGISLDGFIASPDGSYDWLVPFEPPQPGFGIFLKEVGTVVMGRRSYDQMLKYDPWPYPDKRTVVVTRRPLGSAPPPGVEGTSDPADVLADRLMRESDRDIWIFGGSEIARAFLLARRLDTLELGIVPVVIGEGIPLFGSGTPVTGLKLTHFDKYPNGMIEARYDIMP